MKKQIAIGMVFGALLLAVIGAVIDSRSFNTQQFNVANGYASISSGANFTNTISRRPVTYDRTNFFGSIPTREPSWQWDGRAHWVDHTNMEVMTLRHNDSPLSGNSIFHNIIYFGGSGSPDGVGADFSAFSLQVAGGLGQGGYGNPRFSFVAGDDLYTWRLKELHLEDSLLTYAWGSDQLVIGHQLLSHNNLGDLWLAAMGTRTITFVDPTLMTNQLVTLVLNKFDGTVTNYYIALGTNPTVSWGTNFLISATAATTAGNFVGCISNIFDKFAFVGSLGSGLAATRVGAVVSLYQLTGTRDITVTVGAGMTTARGTNGAVNTLGDLTANSFSGNGSQITNVVSLMSNGVLVSQSPTNLNFVNAYKVTNNTTGGDVSIDLGQTAPLATINPSNSNLKVWFKASRDLNGTNGSQVLTNVPAIIGGTFTNKASTAQYRTNIFPNGNSAILFDGTANTVLVSDSSLMNSTMDRSFTLFAVMQVTNNEGALKLVCGQGANFDIGFINENAIQCRPGNLSAANLSVGYPLSNPLSTNVGNNISYIIYCYRWDGTNMWAGDGRNHVIKLATGTLSMSGALVLGANSYAGSSSFRGYLGELLIYTNALTFSNCNAISTALARDYGISTNYATEFFCNGDSMTAGNALNAIDYWPQKLQLLLNQANIPAVTFNSGVNGDTATNILQNISSIYKPPGVVGKHILWIGRNDLDTYSASPAAILSWIGGINSNLTSLGWQTYVVSLPPSSSSDTFYQRDRAEVNRVLGLTGMGSQFIDMSTHTLWYNVSNSVAWQSDKIHPSAAGNEVLAAEVFRVLNGSVNPVTSKLAAFTTSDNPTNQYTTGVLYTNGSIKSWLVGSAVLNAGVSGSAVITILFTNNSVGYQLPIQTGAGVSTTDVFPFSVPLSANAVFTFVSTMGTGATGSLTNVVNVQ